MAYQVISQNNTTTTLADENGNIIRVPARVSLATSTDYTIKKVNNTTATLEDGNGNIIRDVPCVAVLVGGEGGGGGAVSSVNGQTGDVVITGNDVLPDQTGNSGKFLTTDGTDASWSDKPLVNTATGTDSFTIAGNPTSQRWAFNIGETSSASKESSFAVGQGATASGVGSMVIGNYSMASGKSSIAIKASASANYAIGIGGYASAVGAIQIGSYIQSGSAIPQNVDANTVKIANANGNYEMMSADGTIPSERLPNAINKYSTMPTADSTNEGWIVQFTGTTDSTYTHGHLYECVSDGQTPATYSWTEVSMGGGGSSYTAGTGIDITGGVISVTAPTLQNTATGNYSMCIGQTGSSASGLNSLAIGSLAQSAQRSVAIGAGAFTNVDNTVAIGSQAGCYGGSGAVALGSAARANAANAIQIAATNNVSVNSDANTFKVANANGNFEMMSADGTIPAARHAALPAADGTYTLQLVIADGVPTLSWVTE